MIFRKVFDTVETLPKTQSDAGWQAYLGGKGYYVSASTALKVAAVIRCVDVVAKTMASLPLNLYEKTDNGKEKADKHPVYKLLYRLPNPETTAYEFWHMYIFNLMLTQGAYAKIVRDRSGFIRQLWNIPTANVNMNRNIVNGERFIDVFLSGGKSDRLREGEFMYTPGLRFGDSADPEDPVQIAANVLGLTMALDGFAKDYFDKGTNLGGVVELQDTLSEQAYQRFQDSWHKAYTGVTNQHKVAILEGGAKFNSLGQKPSDSQALESRKFQIVEICRMFGVPPHKVFDLDRATFSNIEQQNIEYVQESISPMSVRLEQTIYKDLLTEPERKIYFAKFNVNALLRGDMAARKDFYNTMRQNGVYSANDIRDLEDENKIPKEDGGDEYLVNGNMIPMKYAANNKPKSMQNGG